MASGATSVYLIPYPLSTDPVNVHGDIKALSDRLEIVLGLKVDKNIANILTKTNTYTITGTDDGIIINQAGTGVPLRITNTGTGNSFLVEDSASTDSTPFVIDASGNVGILKSVPTVALDVAGAGAFTGALTASTFNALSLTSNATGFRVSGGTTAVAVTFAGGAAYTISGTNGATYTLPSATGTLVANPLTTLGDILYGGASGAPTRLAGNATNGIYFLRENVTASASVAPDWIGSTGSANVVLSTSPTITTPVIDTINISALGTSGALWNTTITTGSISMGGSLTTGGVNIATGSAFNGTVAIATGAGTVNKTINIGTASTAGTTAIAIGSLSGATSTISLNGTTTINGDLTVNGTTNTLNTNTLVVDDKNIELGSVAAGTISTTGTIGTVSGAGPFTATITAMTSTAGLIPGQVITATAGTGSFGSGVMSVVTIASATSITVSSTLTFTAGNVTNILGQAATDATANGGGITLKGATDKTIVWDSTNANWTSSENWNIASAKTFKINNTSVLSSTVVLGLTPTINATGFRLSGGTTAKYVQINNDIVLAGTDGSTLNIGAGGTLGSAAFTASSAYEPAITTLAISKGGTGTGTAPTQYGVIYATSTTAYASTAAGTNTQVLIGNASGAPTWTNISGLSVSSASTATTATNLSGTTVYSIPYQSASATTGYVSIGTAGQMLAVNGTANGYVWTSPFTNPMTTLGDMVSGGASGAPARIVGPATNGTYGLTSVTTASAATAPVWTLATGTGSPVYATTPTITTPKIDSISTTTGAAATPTLWSDVTTGTIAIGAGITSGTVNIATAGTGANSINIGNTNSTLTVNGNLTVNGTTTTVNSVTITVDDPNLELNSVASPTDANANGGGITLKGTTDKSIIWDNTNSNWTSNQDFNLVTGKVFKINNVAVLSPTVVLGLTPTTSGTGFAIAGGATSKTLTVSNTLTLAGTDSTTMTFPGTSGTVATLNTANVFTTTQTITPATGVTALAINGATSSTGIIIKAAATAGTFIDYQDNNNVSVGSVGSDGTNFIKIIKNVGGTANRAVFSDASSSVIVYAANTNYVPLSVRRFSDSQTSDLQQWTNFSASTVYAKIDKDGNATAASFVKSGGTSSQYLMADGSVTTGVIAAAGTLTGSTLAAGVTASSLTSLGTLTSLSVSGLSTFNSLSIPGTATFSSTVTVPTPTNNTDAANKAYVDSVLNAGVPEIVPLDDISGEFNGVDSVFVPKYQGIKQSITNPLRLQLAINGIIQYVDFPDYVWQSPLPREGFQINNDGNIAFSEVVPAGSRFDAMIQPGPNTITKTRQYPFKAVDILLGG